MNENTIHHTLSTDLNEAHDRPPNTIKIQHATFVMAIYFVFIFLISQLVPPLVGFIFFILVFISMVWYLERNQENSQANIITNLTI